MIMMIGVRADLPEPGPGRDPAAAGREGGQGGT